jgi:arylsulfatase A-like enzyme
MSPALERPNVLVLLMDSVPARRLGCYGYRRPVSPHVDQLALEGVRFRECLSTGAMSPPAHASLFTGLYPDRHGVLLKGEVLPRHLPTLAEVLGRNGYRTWCLSNKMDVGEETALDRGFQKVLEMNRRFPWPLAGLHFRLRRSTMKLRGWMDDGAALSNRRLLSWIDGESGTDTPFFAFINYADAHYPYGAPRSFRFRFTRRALPSAAMWRLFQASLHTEEYRLGEFDLDPEDLEDLSGLFDGGVAYLDHRIGELIGALSRRDLLDRTLVIALADHGEFLGDRGLIGHGQVLYEPVLQVPLLMRLPGRLPRGVIERRSAQICDVMPTILDLLGISWDGMEKIDGVSLLPTGEERPYRKDLVAFIPGQQMLRHGPLKYLRREDGAGELYDLDDDPTESRDLSADRPDNVRFLRARLDAFLAREDGIAASVGS